MSTLKFYKRVKAPPEYPGKTYNNGNCLLHHLVWWQNTGELVPKGFVLHHKNENKFDNRFENLALLSNSEHGQQHGIDRKVEITLQCPVCGALFVEQAHKARDRQKRNADGNICCSRKCGHQHRVNRGIGKSPNGTVLTHGTTRGYSVYRCRCDACRAAHTQKHKEYRARKRGAQV